MVPPIALAVELPMRRDSEFSPLAAASSVRGAPRAMSAGMEA